MRWLWWMMRQDDHDEPFVDGECGEEKVLVTARRDERGKPLEQVWATPETAADWDDTRWGDDWK